MACIRYGKGYEYQLRESYRVHVPELAGLPVITRWVHLTADGWLTVQSGYAWDGPSGPAFDTKNFMRGSLVHDVSYQLMREGHLPPSYREPADSMLRRICREDGMSAIRAWWVYHGVRLGGGPAADPALKEPDECAPGDCAECA